MAEYLDLRKMNRDELFRLRKQVVHLKEKGCSGREIERLTHVRVNRVSEIWHKYLDDGAGGLKPSAPGRKTGEKTLLTPARETEIKRLLIEKTPDELNMPYSLWTRQIASDFIKREYGVRLSLRCMTNYFRKWGFVCKAPLRDTGYRNDTGLACFIEEVFPNIVRRASYENVGIYWYSETRIKNVRIAAAVTARGTARFMFFERNISQDGFIILMSRLIRYADRKVFFIVADSKAFRGKKVKAWLKGRENRIEVFYHPAR